MARFSLGQQVDELERELEQRAKVYPLLIAKKKLGASLADFQTQRLEAALRTLCWLNRHERLIRQRCPELFGEGA